MSLTTDKLPTVYSEETVFTTALRVEYSEIASFTHTL